MIKLAISFPLVGRKQRIHSDKKPKEFYYGSIGLSKKYKTIMVDSRKESSRFTSKTFLFFEKVINRITSFGFYRSRVLLNKQEYHDQNIIFSFTDFYSLNLGLYYKKKINQRVVGAFHGLSDITNRAPFYSQKYLSYKIKKSLGNIDHFVFFGKADMDESIRVYDLNIEKTHLLKFGIDHQFWTDSPNCKESIDILCVGSDVNRDYEILKTLRQDIKIKLLTSKKIDLSRNPNISYIKGNLYKSNVTDEELKSFYHRSKIVLIPLHDVFQPSGYSVALQAMSCGKLVLISKIKGVFDDEFLNDETNISFVKPHCSQSLQDVIDKLINNENIRRQIGSNARKTIIKNFTLKHMSNSLEQILNKV